MNRIKANIYSARKFHTHVLIFISNFGIDFTNCGLTFSTHLRVDARQARSPGVPVNNAMHPIIFMTRRQGACHPDATVKFPTGQNPQKILTGGCTRRSAAV